MEKGQKQITAKFCVNMNGKFKKTLLIGKCGKPWCFKFIDTKTLPVTWEHNKKASMTSAIHQKWLQKFDEKMPRQSRIALLLLDNAPSHPKDVNVRNVEIVILPAITTPIL